MSLPIPNLDDKNFEQLVEEAKKLIPIYAPDWTDHNLHDPGITFIELFAWLSEMQLYSLNRIDDTNYLKYLKLLGSSPAYVQPAKVDITISSGTIVDKGTKFIAEDIQTGERTVFETDESVEISDIKLEKIIIYSDYQYREVSDFNKENKNFFYAFGENPVQDNAIYLGFSNYEQITKLKLMFYLYDDDLPQPGGHGSKRIDYFQTSTTGVQEYWIENNKELNQFFPSAKLKWQQYMGNNQWMEISSCADKTVYFSTGGQISFDNLQNSITSAPSELNDVLFNSNEQYLWLKCEIVYGTYEISPRIERILTNTVPATQCETIENSLLGISTGFPDQVFQLNKKGIIQNSVKISIASESWEEIDDILVADKDARSFQVDYSNSKVIFGNGINGSIPEADIEIQITYKYSDGAKGNIRALSINKNDKGLQATNYFPARSGMDAENIPDAIIRIKKDMLIPYMAVTSKDYENVAKMTPGLRVARAKAIADKLINNVRIIVVPYSFADTPTPSGGFKKTVCIHVDRHRTITTSIKIEDPDYVKVSVTAKITLMDRYNPDNVKKRCQEALKQFLSPIKRKEGDNEWEFGRPVYKSDVYVVLEGVEGVDGVIQLFLAFDQGGSYDSEGNIEINKNALVYSGEHNIEIIDQQLCKEIR